MTETAPLRVLHIITRLIVGGAQENTILSVEGLDAMPEYEVTLVSGVDDGPEGDLLQRAGKTTNLVLVREMGFSINPFSDLIALWKLYRIIRRGRYHIVHTHSSKAGVLGRIAAKLAGTPIIVHTLHAMVFYPGQPWLINRLWRLIKKIVAPMTDHFIGVCDAMNEQAIAAGIDKRPKFSTIRSGMELDWFLKANVDRAAVRRELGIPEDAPVVGKIARFVGYKGHAEMFEAAPEIVRRVPNVRFLMVGDGPLLQKMRDRAREQGVLDHIVFAGLVPRERIPEMIAAMDVLAHTAHHEGLPRVLVQALAMGKPCVSFDRDGAPEVVLPGQTGYLVPFGDTKTLADNIVTLLSDPKLREEMGARGRTVVDPAYRAETMVRDIADLYKALAERYRDRLAAFDSKGKVPATAAARTSR
ncbi:MAG TPA: glycosyltransferase family 4 protein [Thermoanaerobaculia bacterium]|nr:glycosyltransferase family 4 protein [Thermoanaerobaculia bacterium]